MSKVYFLCFVVLVETMVRGEECPKNQDVIQYFKSEIPDLKDDLSKITWHHAVNTEELLYEALESDKQMLECDIVHRVKDGRVVAVMGHNPEDAKSYNLTLRHFLAIFNSNANKKLKGLKLDFKTTEAFEAAMASNELKTSSYPVWINADILKGPGGPDATVRLNYTAYKDQLDCHTLSVGWTTGKVAGATYSRQQLQEMREQRFGPMPKTYAVRAAYVAQSWSDFSELLLTGNEDTLTVWSPEGDIDIIVAADLKKVLVENKSRIFLDVPDNIKKILDDVPSSRGSSIGLSSLVVVLFVLLLF